MADKGGLISTYRKSFTMGKKGKIPDNDTVRVIKSARRRCMDLSMKIFRMTRMFILMLTL